MAFCKYCGRKLEDGEVCHCKDEVNTSAEAAAPSVEATATTTETAAAAATSTFESKFEALKSAPATQQAKEFGTAAWKQYLLLLKAPATNAASYIRSANIANAIAFMVMHALCSSIFALICVSKINSFIGIGGSYTAALKLSGAGAFFQTLLYSLILAVALAGLFLGAAKLMHTEMRFQEALCIASMRSVISIPVVLVSCILMFINIPIGTVCFYLLGTLAGVVFLMAATNTINGLSADRKVYFNLAVILIFVVVSLVFANLVSSN